MIRTIEFGMLPIAKDDQYVKNEVFGTVETCDGSFYVVRRSFSGGLVAVLS
jgi:hypothetical protein